MSLQFTDVDSWSSAISIGAIGIGDKTWISSEIDNSAGKPYIQLAIYDEGSDGGSRIFTLGIFGPHSDGTYEEKDFENSHPSLLMQMMSNTIYIEYDTGFTSGFSVFHLDYFYRRIRIPPGKFKFGIRNNGSTLHADSALYYRMYTLGDV